MPNQCLFKSCYSMGLIIWPLYLFSSIFFLFLFWINWCCSPLGLPRWFSSKEFTYQCKTGLIPGWRRSLGEGNGNPFQFSCLGNPTDREETGGLQLDSTYRLNNNNNLPPDFAHIAPSAGGSFSTCFSDSFWTSWLCFCPTICLSLAWVSSPFDARITGSYHEPSLEIICRRPPFYYLKKYAQWH